jgi:hypothetical protein
MRKTNPIWPRGTGIPGRRASQLCDIASMPRFGKQTQFFDCGLCETNPICPPPRWDQRDRSRDIASMPRFGQQSQSLPWEASGGDAQPTKRRLCETKPIRGDAAGDGAWGTRDEGCCTNKPNSYHGADPEIGVPGRANCAKQSQFARLRRVGGATGAWDVGTNAQNEPNSSIADSERPAARRLGPVRAGCTNKPNSTRSRRGSLYKQTQFSRSPGKRQVPCGKRVMVDWAWTGLRQNKANSPLRIADFGLRIVRNKANSRRARYPTIPLFHSSNPRGATGLFACLGSRGPR